MNSLPAHGQGRALPLHPIVGAPLVGALWLRRYREIWRCPLLQAESGDYDWIRSGPQSSLFGPKSPKWAGYQCPINLWPHLKLFAEDGRLEIANNLIKKPSAAIGAGAKKVFVCRFVPTLSASPITKPKGWRSCCPDKIRYRWPEGYIKTFCRGRLLTG